MESLDANNDGFVDENEVNQRISNIAQETGKSDAEIREFFSNADRDDDNRLSADEFDDFFGSSED